MLIEFQRYRVPSRGDQSNKVCGFPGRAQWQIQRKQTELYFRYLLHVYFPGQLNILVLRNHTYKKMKYGGH